MSRLALAVFLMLGSARLRAAAVDRLEPLDVNGTKQWILSRGRDDSKPVLLFVHGGPGSPLMFFSRGFDDPFLGDFVVVHWDQRGAGKSYSASIPPKTINLDQIVSDGLVVVAQLKKKFHASKIILVGHSWGTIVASHMAAARPEDFFGFVSVGTVADFAAADKLKYEFVEAESVRRRDAKTAAALKKLGPPPYVSAKQVVTMSGFLWSYGAIWHNFSGEDIEAAIDKSTEYTKKDMETFVTEGAKLSLKQLLPALLSYKAADAVPKLEVPVVFVQGRYDMATPLAPAQSYFDGLQAPAGKKMVIFENSAHYAMYDQPREFLDVLRSLPSSSSAVTAPR